MQPPKHAIVARSKIERLNKLANRRYRPVVNWVCAHVGFYLFADLLSLHLRAPSDANFIKYQDETGLKPVVAESVLNRLGEIVV